MTPQFWQGKKVFLTGHTGFKGSWLTMMLQLLGADVYGYSLPPDTSPSLFEDTDLAESMHSTLGDIRDADSLLVSMQQASPDIVLHLAAQAIVSTSYNDPLFTFQTNVLGTANVLEAVRQVSGICAVVLVTTDKCYENNESGRAYQESDALGGKDPYSASKACAELVVASWRYAFLSREGQAVIASARAGNVIGGGDWSKDRLIPDIMRSFMQDKPALLRSPESIRPWQHVLESLNGYLMLAEHCAQNRKFAEAWNFGPDQDDILTVRELADSLADIWGAGAAWNQDGVNPVKEANTLRLDSSKAKRELGWKPQTSVYEGLQMTADWYKRFGQGEQALLITREQIESYLARSTS